MSTPEQLIITKNFQVSAETVFNAWVDPAIIKQWLFKSDTNEIVKADIDLTVGGAFSIMELSEGEEIDHAGVYKNIEAPSTLIFSLQVPKHFSETTEVSVHIESRDWGTKMTFTQTGIDPSKTEKQWKQMLTNLQNLIDEDEEEDI
jgi:uncharacterized protein YndB with AHSA1/START domain